MKAPLAAVILFFLAASFVFVPVLAETGCTQNKPDISISPSRISSPPGQTVAFTIDVDNEDSDNCAIRNFLMSGTSELGTNPSFRPTQLSIQPQESETTLMTVKVPSDARVGTYTVDAFVDRGQNLFDSAKAEVEVLEKLESCEVRVSNLRFKEKNDDEFKDEFSSDDEVGVIVDVSLIGNVNSDVQLTLFADGKIISTETDHYTANSDTTFRFGNRIITKNYVDNIDVKVVATPSCNPENSDDDKETIELTEGDEEIDIDVDVGKPGNTIVGQEVTSRVFIENTGEKDVKVNVDGRLCTTGSKCTTEMFCGESVVLIEKDDIDEILCRVTPTASGTYHVEINVFFNNDEDVEKSLDFVVSEVGGPVITPTGQVNESQSAKLREITYTCSGNVRQALYTTSQGQQTSDIEFCPLGCSNGRCLQTATPSKSSGVPTTDVKEAEEILRPKYNPPVFDLGNFFDWFKSLFFSKTN